MAIDGGFPAVRVCVLGSGSGGNCTWIGYGEDAILVDAGLSARRTIRTLRELGLDERKVRASCNDVDHVTGGVWACFSQRISYCARIGHSREGSCWQTWWWRKMANGIGREVRVAILYIG